MPVSRDKTLFLFQHGWEHSEDLPQDGTNRTYARVRKDDKTALMMHVPPDENTLPEFLRIGEYLKNNGINVPDVYETNESQGLALIQDFGETPMRVAIERGDDIDGLYDKALGLLEALKGLEKLPPLMDYSANAVHIGRQRIVGWYLPAATGHQHDKDEIDRYFAVWDEIERSIPHYKTGFVHGDFHVDNLMLLDDGSLGLIDFQDAMSGSPFYDLGNLLEDMRMEVPQDIQARALAKLSAEDRAWMRILTTQFHCRLLGQCIRWAIVANKPQYLRFLPRLENYVLEALKDPILKPLKQYFSEIGLDFTVSKDLNIDAVKPLIRPNAF